MDETCHVEPIHKITSPEEEINVKLATLAIWGMGCPNCANRVRNNLLLVNGVLDAYVDHVAGMAQVAFNPSLASVEALIGAVVRAGGDGRHEYRARLLHRT